MSAPLWLVLEKLLKAFLELKLLVNGVPSVEERLVPYITPQSPKLKAGALLTFS